MMPPPIRVLIVDDHPMVRDGIAALLSRQADMEPVGEASNGIEAIEKFRELSPDLTLMDVQMPGMGGVEAIAEIRSLAPDARILVLTTYPGDANAARAMRAGAAGYLLKNGIRLELIDAIRSVHSGRRAISADIAHAIATHALDDMLTDREVEILRLVSEGHANKQIAWRLNLSNDTIKAQLKAIFTKLGVHDRTHAVTLATRRGYINPFS
ncbi:response regulator transcription factor [Novosphingobium sp. JCM 18896]|uniref:response regulator transcription factor n=1 Tax=Novosphingobium sp. JCM 18896 TaxID=2989731 RepID=UPI002222AFF8|nr:response regulator transcription factor [Novosphingobium sp. JCM 18896]MCW1430636.1 response regulator transcription factor [Novosphingobium sp. JCM 18896]